MDHASHARSVCIKSEAANISPKVPDKRQHRTRTECPPRPIYRRRSCHHSAVSWSRSAQHCPPTHYQMHHTEPESAAKKKTQNCFILSRSLLCIVYSAHCNSVLWMHITKFRWYWYCGSLSTLWYQRTKGTACFSRYYFTMCNF